MTNQTIINALKRAVADESGRSCPQESLARIARFMGVVGIAQCPGDIADEAIKRLDDAAQKEGRADG